MVTTQGNRVWATPLQGKLMLVMQPPSPELALILCSLEDINEALKGHQSINVKVEPPPYRVGNP
jgi:hypothetical protein